MLPDSFPIRGDELRHWLNSAGQGLLLQFDSGAAALRFIRSEGMMIRTSDFYAIYRDVSTRAAQHEVLEGLPLDQLIPAAETITNHGWQLSDNFLYRFRVDGWDPQTGDPISKYFAVNSDRQLTPNEAAEMLAGLIEGESEFYGIDADSYTLDGAYAMPGILE